MVRRNRFRTFFFSLALYALSGGLGYYFINHAHHGERGLKAKQEIKAAILDVSSELEQVKQERMEWDRRVALLKSDEIDRDLLEERARLFLGRLHRNDVVIMLPPERQ